MTLSDSAAVLATLAYTEQFLFPLNIDELYQRLIKSSSTKSSITASLKKLQKLGLIEQQQEYWKLRAGQADLDLRLSREALSKTRQAEIQELLKIIGWIPWIRGIAVTGSLAMNNARPKSDIDVLIVVDSKRLWMSRLAVSLITLAMGKRRTWSGGKTDSWCFNLWFDSRHLALSKNRQNLYSAYEICQAKWIYDRHETKNKFYQDNNWVKFWLPHYFEICLQESSLKGETEESRRPAPIFRFIGRRLLDLLNYIVFIFQYGYMYGHMTREEVALGKAYFHPRSTKNLIYQHWYNSLVDLWIK
jgi:hypothetical protein